MDKELLARIVAQMPFTALDYKKDAWALTEKAARLYTEATGNGGPVVADEIESALRQAYSERKQLSVEVVDMPVHMKDGDIINVALDHGVILTGRAGISPKLLCVEMLSPMQGCKACSQLKMLAPVIWTVRPEEGSEADEECRQRIVSMLLDIYYENMPNFIPTNTSEQ